MADLIALSTRIIDDHVTDVPVNRITQELSELLDDVAIVESFSHVVAFRTAEGLVLFDTSGKFTGERVRQSLRGWSEEPVHTIVYTHGHVDHVGGAGAFMAEAEARGRPRPRIVGHAAVGRRFARYRRTNGYNLQINRRQFDTGSYMPEHFLPPETPDPGVTFDERLGLNVGGLKIDLTHARGETDDHLWAWLPDRKIIAAGDFFIWNFPNAGNPQKAQRYPLEWAGALRAMAECGAELFIPAHGLPIAGAARIRRILLETAGALEKLVDDTLERMNAGQSLDEIVAEVRVDASLLDKPYLRPLYDEPEFVVHNVYRLYGGWYDGNPAHLKPPRFEKLALEVVALVGGPDHLVRRASELAGEGEFRLACELVEMAVAAAPESRQTHHARYAVYRARRKAESSLMAKGIYGTASRESWEKAHPDEPYPHTADPRLRL